MSHTIRPGGRVRVAFQKVWSCTRHDLANVSTEGLIGVALDLWRIGTQWSDSFRPDGLEPV